ncbi:MAG: CBS domain-containing protein, partial [Anaerolineaceae bacterium]
MSETIMELLQQKDSEVFSVQVDASLLDTLRLMAEKRIGFVPVMEGEKLVGLYSERDFARLMAVREDIPL